MKAVTTVRDVRPMNIPVRLANWANYSRSLMSNRFVTPGILPLRLAVVDAHLPPHRALNSSISLADSRRPNTRCHQWL